MMSPNRLLLATVIAAAASLAAPPVPAATDYDAASVWSGTNHDEMFQVSDALAYMLAKTQFDTVKTNDPANPMNGASGTCFGSAAVEGHLATGNGYCTVEDAAHQKFVVHWDVTAVSQAGAVSGNWELEGGSSRWTGAKGGGTFETTADPKNHHEVNTVAGRFTLQ